MSGTAVTKFTSPQAMAKPLGAFLDVAEKHPGGLDGFLDEHAAADVVAVFVDARSAGLKSGDATGFRGVATSTPQSAKDWLKARTAAMKCDSPPVQVVNFDPLGERRDPGAWVVFRRNEAGWGLETCYPDSDPRQGSKRLENFA